MLSFSQFMSQSDEDAILTTAPCRADLAGGTLDIWPLYLFHPGAVSVNIALEIQTACRITARPDCEIHLQSHDTGREERFGSLDELLSATSYAHPLAAFLVGYFLPQEGFSLETHSESPAGAGISGSSALMVATAAALAQFTDRHIEPEPLRVIVQNIEAQLIGVPTGCQDYYPAIYGGVNAIHLAIAGVRREPIAVSADEMNQRFVLFYTGAPRQSGINNWEVFKQHIDGDQQVIRNFAEISQIAQAMCRSLAKADWHAVESLIRQEWELRRTNAPGITTPLIEKLIGVAMQHGARAAKVCGAGGGGCVIAIVDRGSRQAVEDAISRHGGLPLNFRVAPEGLRVQAVLRQTAKV